MKFHWGHGIFAFYSFFVVTLIIVVVKSTGFDNSLVTEEYYARDINYQQEYDRRLNSNSLEKSVVLELTKEGKQLHFPTSQPVEGTVLFYRPSSKKHDLRQPINATNGRMQLDLSNLKFGRYQLIIEWKTEGVSYYDELDLTVTP